MRSLPVELVSPASSRCCAAWGWWTKAQPARCSLCRLQGCCKRAWRRSMASMSSDPHYRAPDWFTRNVFNRIVAAFTRAGISVWGSRILEVPGRKTGVPRRTPVNVLSLGAGRYLVAPRGHTQWVRNLRAVGEGELLLGRRREHFQATEI